MKLILDPLKLVQRRAEARLTQAELARQIGVSRHQIGRYETGKTQPRLSTIFKLAKALNVGAESLCNTTEDHPVASTMFLDDETNEKLCAIAKQVGLTPEKFASVLLGDSLAEIREKSKQRGVDETDVVQEIIKKERE